MDLQIQNNSSLYKWKDVPRLPVEESLQYLYKNFDKINFDIDDQIRIYHLILGDSEIRIEASDDIQMIKKICALLEVKFPNITIENTDIKELFV